MKPPDLDHLTPYYRDWLEVHGNQWGTKRHGERPTAEEAQAVHDALNPYKRIVMFDSEEPRCQQE